MVDYYYSWIIIVSFIFTVTNHCLLRSLVSNSYGVVSYNICLNCIGKNNNQLTVKLKDAQRINKILDIKESYLNYFLRPIFPGTDSITLPPS